MPERRPFRYAVIRVVPDAVAQEPINIGIIVHDVEQARVYSRFTAELAKLGRPSYVTPPLDVDALDAMVESLEAGFESNADKDDLLAALHAQYTNIIQFSMPQGTLAADPAQELDGLYARFVTLDERGKREVTGVSRRSLVAMTRRALQTRSVAFEPRRTLRGQLDQFTFDFIHENHALHAIQCISFGLEAPDATKDAVKLAKVVAYSVEDIRHGPQVSSPEAFEFLSILHPPPRESERYRTSVKILEGVGEVVEGRRQEDLVAAVGRLVEG